MAIRRRPTVPDNGSSFVHRAVRANPRKTWHKRRRFMKGQKFVEEFLNQQWHEREEESVCLIVQKETSEITAVFGRLSGKWAESNATTLTSNRSATTSCGCFSFWLDVTNWCRLTETTSYTRLSFGSLTETIIHRLFIYFYASRSLPYQDDSSKNYARLPFSLFLSLPPSLLLSIHPLITRMRYRWCNCNRR